MTTATMRQVMDYLAIVEETSQLSLSGYAVERYREILSTQALTQGEARGLLLDDLRYYATTGEQPQQMRR